MKMRVLLVISLVICLISAANATPGLAVYYDPSNVATACTGRPESGMVTGVSASLWNGGRACGKRYGVRCSGPAYGFQNPCTSSETIYVTVVDFCQNKCNGDFNLHRNAFDRIANTRAGKIKIDYFPA